MYRGSVKQRSGERGAPVRHKKKQMRRELIISKVREAVVVFVLGWWTDALVVRTHDGSTK